MTVYACSSGATPPRVLIMRRPWVCCDGCGAPWLTELVDQTNGGSSPQGDSIVGDRDVPLGSSTVPRCGFPGRSLRRGGKPQVVLGRRRLAWKPPEGVWFLTRGRAFIEAEPAPLDVSLEVPTMPSGKR